MKSLFFNAVGDGNLSVLAQPGFGPRGRDNFRGTGKRIELEDLPSESRLAKIPDRAMHTFIW